MEAVQVQFGVEVLEAQEVAIRCAMRQDPGKKEAVGLGRVGQERGPSLDGGLWEGLSAAVGPYKPLQNLA